MRITKNNYFFFCTLTGIAVLAGLLYFISHKHGDMVLFINRYSTDFLDVFFFAITDIGLGWVAAIIMVFLLIYRLYWGILLGVDLFFTSLFTNIFKRQFFGEISRPLLKLYYTDIIRWIDGVELNWYRSFPSGHTMTIFAVCAILSYLFNRRGLTLLFFLLALLVGISRMYLLQHFLIDVTVGAVLGIAATGLALFVVNCWWKLPGRTWSSYSVFSLLRDK